MPAFLTAFCTVFSWRGSKQPRFLYWLVGENLAASLLTHLQRMPLVVIENKALGPIDVAFLVL
jgi:hypothetical protein